MKFLPFLLALLNTGCAPLAPLLAPVPAPADAYHNVIHHVPQGSYSIRRAGTMPQPASSTQTVNVYVLDQDLRSQCGNTVDCDWK